MEIRKAIPAELEDICEIYAKARAFMVKTGNPRQWNRSAYPPIELIKKDIKDEKLYVCTENGKPVCAFFYTFGENAEPLYSKFSATPVTYGVVHRIASDGSVKGVGRFCLSWAIEKSGKLMIDTHPDNKVMQGLLSSLGFTYIGDINIPDDDDIRLVYYVS